MEGYIEELRRRKAEGRYPLDAYEEEEVAEADALAVKCETFKEGDLVYMPKLGDSPTRPCRLLLIYRDDRMGGHMALIESSPDFSSAYPLLYVEKIPVEEPAVDTLAILLIVIGLPALAICGFIYHSM